MPCSPVVVLSLAVGHGVLAHFTNALRDVRSHAMRREQGMLIGVGMQMLSHADNLRMTGRGRPVLCALERSAGA